MGNVAYELYVDIKTNLSGFYNGLKEAKNGLSGFGGAVMKGVGTIGKIGIAAVGAATAAGAAFATSAVKVGSSFDSAMSQVSATLGMTTEDIKNNVNGAGDAYQALRDKAEEAGRTTIFSASESAEGLNILAMSGYSAQESIAMLDDVLHLAAAGSMDMASAASYVSGTMKGFNDDTKDSAYYADLMAKGATLANTSVQQLGEAMSSGAAGAAAYGQSADSMTVSLLRLAEQGEVGSAAGTALAAAMKNLYTPTNQAKGALKKLGVEAFDKTTGKARDFNDVVNELDAALQGYTEAEQAAYKQTIFGIQGLDAFNKMTVTGIERQEEWADALAKASYDVEGLAKSMTDVGVVIGNTNVNMNDMADEMLYNWKRLGGDADAFAKEMQEYLEFEYDVSTEDATKAIEAFTKTVQEQTGEAAKQYGTMTDNLEGDIKGWGSALEGFQVAISDKLMPTIREFVQFGTSGLSKITDAFKSGGLDAAMEAFGQVLADGVNMIVAELPNLVSAGAKLLGALGKGLLDNLDVLLDAAKQIFEFLVNSLVDATSDTSGIVEVILKVGEALLSELPTLLKAVIDLSKNLFTGLADALPELIPAFIESMIECFIMLLTNVDQFLAIAEAILVGIVQGLMNSIPIFVENIPEIWNKIVTAVTVTIPEAFLSIGQAIIESILAGLEQYFPGITQAFTDHMTEAKEKISNILQGIKTVIDNVIAWWSPLVSAIGNFLSAIWGLIVARVQTIASSIGAFLESQKTQINAFIITAKAILDVFLKTIWNLLSGVITNIKNLVTLALNFIANIIKTVTAIMKGDWQGAWENIKTTVTTAKDDLIRLVTGIKDGFVKVWTDIIETAKNWGRDMIENIIGGITEKIGGVVDAVKGVGQKIKDNIGFSVPKEGPLHDFDTYAPDMMKLFAEGIKENEDLVWKQLERSFDFSDVLANQNVSVAGSGSGVGVNNVVTMNIYPSAGMDEKALAKEISYQLSVQENRSKITYQNSRTKATWRLANA